MAHFAQVDETNTVLQVLVVNNTDITNEHGEEVEQLGIAWLQQLFGADTRWIQTSYNNKFRVRYAGIGYTYDPTLDAFLIPQPFPSWVLNETTCLWEPPIPMPNDATTVPYSWNETLQQWQHMNM